MSYSIPRYWFSVVADPNAGLCDTWPEGVQVWKSGETPDEKWTWCLIIDTDGDPRRVVDGLWSEWEERFSLRKDPWWVPSDRFPNAKPQIGSEKAPCPRRARGGGVDA